MHPSRLRLGPSQSRPLTDASPGSARSPGLRVCRAAPTRHRNIHTHAPFRTERQSFLPCRDMSLTISRKQRSGHAVALRRQRPQVRILSGAISEQKKNCWRSSSLLQRRGRMWRGSIGSAEDADRRRRMARQQPSAVEEAAMDRLKLETVYLRTLDALMSAVDEYQMQAATPPAAGT
jgi:hypothetical protein